MDIQPTVESYKTCTFFCFSEWPKKLFSMLEVVSSLEDLALQTVIEEFTDTFALSPDELKCT